MTSSNSSTSPTDFDSRNSLLKWTGSLAANATITVPSVPMQWMMYNATNKTLTFTTGAGTTAVVETGDTIPIYSDGINVRTLGYGTYNLKDYIAAQVLASSTALPGQVGNAGKYLYTDGANATWRQPATSDLSDYNTAVLGVQVALAVSL